MTRVAHSRKVGCNTMKYMTAFLYTLNEGQNLLVTIYFAEPPPLTGAWKDNHMMRGKKQQVRHRTVD